MMSEGIGEPNHYGSGRLLHLVALAVLPHLRVFMITRLMSHAISSCQLPNKTLCHFLDKGGIHCMILASLRCVPLPPILSNGTENNKLMAFSAEAEVHPYAKRFLVSTFA